MDEQKETLSLVNLKDGAAVEMFDLALAETLANINDPNTSMKPRKIILEVTVAPADEHRTFIGYLIDCKKKLCGQEPEKGMADLRIEKGRAVAYDRTPRQKTLFDNVTQIKGGSEK